jgi:hypothetical protein
MQDHTQNRLGEYRCKFLLPLEVITQHKKKSRWEI